MGSTSSVRRTLRRLCRESGFSLPFTLVVMAALTAAGVTTVHVATSSGHTAVRATADVQAYQYAESGVNDAMATLDGPGANALSSTVLPPPPPDPGAARIDYDRGYVLWGGTLDPITSRWTITAVGHVPNPAGAGLAERTRTLTAVSQVVPSLTQPLNNQVWNYIYSWRVGGSGACDVQVDNNVVLSAPLYVEGNLCVSNNATITEQPNSPPTPVSVVVKGKLQISNNAQVGTTSQPLSELHVTGGCGSSLGSVHTCTAADPIHTRLLDSTPPPISPPTPDWTGWYQSAGLGPHTPCQAGSVNPPSFDSDGILNLATNGNAPSFGGGSTNTVNLTPTFSYTCTAPNAELSWDAVHKVLTVKGVIYVDGNVTVGNGAVNEYNGMATLYATGTFTMTNNAMMCGKRNASNTDCSFSGATGWNPNTEMLIVVAHGHDGSGNSVVLSNNAKWEGGIYAYANMSLVNNAVVEGPMILGGIEFSNNMSAKPFPVINTVPLGAPGNPNVHADPSPPTILG